LRGTADANLEGHNHPDDLNLDLQYVVRLLAGEIQTYSRELRYIRKDNTHIWINLTVSLVCEASGEPEYFICVVQDISDRKQAESALKESLRWLQAVIQASPNAFYIYDLIEQRGVYNNPELYSILGYMPEEVQQMGTAVISQLMHPEDITAFREYLNSNLAPSCVNT